MIFNGLRNESLLNYTQLKLFDASSILSYIGREEWKRAREKYISIHTQRDQFIEWIEGVFPSLRSFSKLSLSRQYLLLNHRACSGNYWKERTSTGKRVAGGWWISPKITRTIYLIPKSRIGKEIQRLNSSSPSYIWRFSAVQERKILRSIMERVPILFGESLRVSKIQPISTSFQQGKTNLYYFFETYNLHESFTPMVTFYLHYLRKKYSKDVSKPLCN